MAMSRQVRRGYQKKLRGKETFAELFIKPTLDRTIFLPVGSRLKSANGFDIWITADIKIQPRWWWKLWSKINPKWEPLVKVPARFS